jgi:hypothetical protein
MTALAPLSPKLSKLIRLFGSDRDGEALGAVRAAEQMLKGAGFDWHTLADTIAREPEPEEPTTWHELARWCRDHDDGRLSAKERWFVSDMTARLVCRGEPSPKQAEWLRSIYARLQRGTP